MKIMGLDPSQSCGWAIYDDQLPISAMLCGVLKVKGVRGKFELNAGQLAPKLVELIKAQGKPDFAVIEQAPRRPFSAGKNRGPEGLLAGMGVEQESEAAGAAMGGLQATLSTNQMAATCAAVLGAYKVPFITMTDETWRKLSYGFGRNKGWGRAEWKKHARQKCGQVRITVTNDDMAEACWIAFAGASSQEFKMLQMQRQAA
ncbi:hypothetical protein [Nitratireductor basaltis]|uniref:Uncharacterized protein n=1 Tax=Nitratireductor basaltis TaxID=472175 RepID=A0A084UBM0_9HYPH|nr:hypothetical protein [Nitratireductor basaltis]KFB10356.1 hypothetical protein EL18_01387 [Nitratireductor basaltis]